MKARWLIAMAVVALLLGGIGTAGAAKLLTGKDVRNRSLHGSDIARGTISKSNLSKGVQGMLDSGTRQQTAASQSPGAQGQAGARGEKGEKGDKGDRGDKGDKGDQGDPGDPAFATLVTPFENFNHTDPSTPQDQWGDDLFACGNGNPTGTQGFVNGISQDFAGQDTPAGSGAFAFKNSGNVDTAFVLHNGAFEGADLADLTEFRFSEIWDGDGPADSPYVELRVDQDGNPATDDIVVLFFVPANANGLNGSPKQGALQKGVWQTWNLALDGVVFGQNGDPGDGYTTLAAFLQANPKAKLRASGFEGAIRLAAGCGQNTTGNFKAAVDNVVISFGKEKVLYDMEAS